MNNDLAPSKTARLPGSTNPIHRILYSLLALFIFVLPPALGDVGTVVILLLSAAIGAALLRQNGLRVRFDLVTIMFGSAFCLMAIAFVVSAREPSDMLFAFNFIPLLLALPVLHSLIYQRTGNFVVLAMLASGGTILAVIIAWVQVQLMGDHRAGGHVINAIHFSNVTITLGLFSLSGALLVRERYALLFLVPLGCALLACILAASRGPLLAVAVVLPIFLIFLGWQSRRLALALAAGSVIVGFAAFAMMAAVAPEQLARVQNMVTVIPDALLRGETGDTSTNIRLALIAAGIEAYQDAPWFGHGWSNIISATHPHMSEWLFAQAEGFDYLHNEPLDFVVGAGVPGIVAYVLILAAPLAGVLSFPKDRYFVARLYLAIMLSLSFLVFGLTSRLLGHALQLTLFAFMTAYIVGYARNAADRRLGGTRQVNE